MAYLAPMKEAASRNWQFVCDDRKLSWGAQARIVAVSENVCIQCAIVSHSSMYT